MEGTHVSDFIPPGYRVIDTDPTTVPKCSDIRILVEHDCHGEKKHQYTVEAKSFYLGYRCRYCYAAHAAALREALWCDTRVHALSLF
jgi:hypothetical protein